MGCGVTSCSMDATEIGSACASEELGRRVASSEEAIARTALRSGVNPHTTASCFSTGGTAVEKQPF